MKRHQTIIAVILGTMICSCLPHSESFRAHQVREFVAPHQEKARRYAIASVNVKGYPDDAKMVVLSEEPYLHGAHGSFLFFYGQSRMYTWQFPDSVPESERYLTVVLSKKALLDRVQVSPKRFPYRAPEINSRKVLREAARIAEDSKREKDEN